MSDGKAKVKGFTDEQKTALLQKIQKDLPDKWIVQFSQKHADRVYFFNKANGTRTWEHPSLTSGRKTGQNVIGQKRKSDEASAHKLSRDTDHSEVKKAKEKRSNENEDIAPCSMNIQGDQPKTLLQDSSTKAKRKRKNRKKKNKQTVNPISNPTALPNLRFESPDGSMPSTSSSKLFMPKSESLNIVLTDVPQSTIIKDVEMIDLNIKHSEKADPDKQKEEALTEDNKTPPGKCVSVIIDTNVLLCGQALSRLERSVQRKPTDSNVTFIIPWVVLQELDHLKKKKSEARRAITFLNMQFQVNHSLIRGQSIFEAATVIDSLIIENNDDRILQCCFFMRQSYEGNVPVLLTRDKNLMNKAMSNGIRCIEDIIHLKTASTEVKIETPSQSPVKTPINRMIPSIVDQNDNNITCIGSDHTLQSMQDDRNKQILPSCLDVSTIYEKSCAHMLSALTYIFEKEMKNAFDDLWLDVVLKKPPWALKDVLLCIRKHWLAVFKVMEVDQIMQVHVERLRNLQKSFHYKSAIDIPSVREWLCSAISLIKGIDQKGKYDEPVKSNLNELQNLHQSLKTGIKAEKLRSVSHSENLQGSNLDTIPLQPSGSDSSTTQSDPEETSIEMAVVDDLKSTEFWVALDKIWTSIISHCGMIFQSLKFVPSRLEDAPEVCQALSATFQTIPQKPLAARALPLIIDLVQSLQSSLQKLISLPAPYSKSERIFMGLLQTLWATVQAFCIDCNIHGLISSHKELALSIVASSEMVQRLTIGLRQLEIVKELLGECLTVVSTASAVFFE